MKISNSKAKTYRRCPNQYRYKYVMGLRTKKKVAHLERGSWMHTLLETHYNGEDWEEMHSILCKRFYAMFEEEREDLGDLPGDCLRIMRSYLRYYEQEDQQYTVVDSELNELITLPNGLILNIIVDLVVEDDEGYLWIWDHKFRKNFEDTENMLLDPQLTLYYWGMEKLGYTPLKGAVYNEVRTKPPSIPAKLKSGGLSRRKDIDTDVYTYAKAIKENGESFDQYTDMLRSIGIRQKDKFFRRTYMPKDPPMMKTMMAELVRTAQQITADERKLEAGDPHAMPRTFDKSCKWGCDYRDLCMAELHGGDISTMIRMNFRTGKESEDDKRGIEATTLGSRRRAKVEVS